jgi:hypothetical protein
MPPMSPAGRAALLALATIAAAGCGRTPPDFFLQGGGDGSGSGSSTGPENDSESTGLITCSSAPEVCVAELSLRRAVDILFVVDNSGSMGGEQGTLAKSFGTFIDVLESQQVGANYRIAVTTTDSLGAIRATSCRSRLEEFISDGPFGYNDETQRGCLDHCTIENLGLGYPWLEKSNGTTNLPDGVTMAQALQCIGPQGISGFGFEAPLESMRLALLDTGTGFVRDDALLAIIFVTDEADCSMSDENLSWINSLGWVSWTTPERASSASCWLAGTTCVGGPGVYDDCFSVDKDQTGAPTTDPELAVLYPLQRYVDTLTELAATKQSLGGQSEVLLAVLAGVPLDYPETGMNLYADSPDWEFNQEYGIGPACGMGTETLDDPPGIPAVRLREFAEAFESESRNVSSICAEDYGSAMQGIADAIGEINTRACVGGCVSDQRYDIPGFQPECSLVETFTDAVPDSQVLPCVETELGWDFPTPELHVCYRALTDTGGQTATAFDDMSAQCVTLESNLELVVERRDGVPVAAGTAVGVTCQLDAPVGVTCDEV